MFKLCRVRPFDIYRRLILLHDPVCSKTAIKVAAAVDLSLFHLGLVGTFHKEFRCSTMDAVLVDTMAGAVQYGLDWISLTTKFNLVAFHDFLNGSTDITDPHVDSGKPSSIRVLGHVQGKCTCKRVEKMDIRKIAQVAKTAKG